MASNGGKHQHHRQAVSCDGKRKRGKRHGISGAYQRQAGMAANINQRHVAYVAAYHKNNQTACSENRRGAWRYSEGAASISMKRYLMFMY